MSPKLTILVPTFNRRPLLERCLRTLLDQDPDAVVRVFDSGSSDDTVSFLAGLDHPRLEIPTAAGTAGDPPRDLFGNWSRAVASVTTPYFAIVADDDFWHDGYARAAIDALDQNPGAGMAFTDVELVDINDDRLGVRSTTLPIGPFSGTEYLERIVNGENIIIDSSAAVIRTEVLAEVGGLDAPHMNHDIIFNYQFRIAAEHDLVRVPGVQVAIRRHNDQSHQETAGALAAVGMAAERMEAASLLLTSPKAADPDYRAWLAERVTFIGRLRSQYTTVVAPGLNDPAELLLDRAASDILSATGDHETIAVAGDDLLSHAGLLSARAVRPFPEVDGHYGGVPADDASAIAEVQRCVADGVAWLAVAWPSFWWLDYYHGLRSHLGGVDNPVANSRVLLYRIGADRRKAGDG